MDSIEKDLNEIMEYIKDLKEENRKQKEILDILKPYIYIVEDGIRLERKFFCVLNEDDEEKARKIRRWLDNDK